MLLPVHPDETEAGYAHYYYLYLIVDVLPDAATHSEAYQVALRSLLASRVQTTPVRSRVQAAISPRPTEPSNAIPPLF